MFDSMTIKGSSGSSFASNSPNGGPNVTTVASTSSVVCTGTEGVSVAQLSQKFGGMMTRSRSSSPSPVAADATLASVPSSKSTPSSSPLSSSSSSSSTSSALVSSSATAVAAAEPEIDYFGTDYDYDFNWGSDGLGTIKLGKDTVLLRKNTFKGAAKPAWGE